MEIGFSVNLSDILTELLLEAGVTRTYSEVIAYEELADLYALEGISPPDYIKARLGDLLEVERDSLPEIEAEYIINKTLQTKKEFYLQVKIANYGEGIAWNVNLRFNTTPDLKLLSMYPHRIIEQLNYDSTVIETFKVKPLKTGEINLPSIFVDFMTTNKVKHKIKIPAKKIVIE